jgi:ribonuclease HI
LEPRAPVFTGLH